VHSLTMCRVLSGSKADCYLGHARLPRSSRTSILLSPRSRMTMTLIPQAVFGFAEIDPKFRFVLFTACHLYRHTPSHQDPIAGPLLRGRCPIVSGAGEEFW
jgi:hypothetical protein